jgi:predicted PurR-regulated permease PerM
MLALALPPVLGSPEWRVGILQQLGDRSIILLFGTALIMYGNLDSRLWLRRLALFCLLAGIAFHLSCILVIRDGMELQQRAAKNISAQAAQLQTQIQQGQNNPTATAKITPEQLERASQLVTNQAASLKQNAKTGIVKTGFSSIGNLLVVGLGLISLGRYGIQLRRKG